MKRLAFLAILLTAWFCAPAHAQFNGCSSFCGTSSSAIADAPGFNNIQASGGGCADANVVAWKAAVVTAGGTVSAGQLTNVCTLVGSLKAHSLFSIQDRIWLHASENTQQATIDIVNLGVATPTSAPTFTASQGYAGNGTTSFLNSGYTSGTNFTQNSASTSTYVRTSRTINQIYSAVGRNDPASTGNSTFILPLQNSNTTTYDVNDTAFSSQATVGTNAQGFWTASRTGATAVALYHNSSSTAASTSAAPSITLPTSLNFFIGARNTNGTADEFSADQLAITTMGGGMTGAQAAQFQTDLNAYMTAIGTNVY